MTPAVKDREYISFHDPVVLCSGIMAMRRLYISPLVYITLRQDITAAIYQIVALLPDDILLLKSIGIKEGLIDLHNSAGGVKEEYIILDAVIYEAEFVPCL